MVQKERLHFKQITFTAIICCFISCTNTKKEGEITSSSFFVDTSFIPKDTVLSDKLTLDNGVYYLNNKPFSGYRKELYTNNKESFVGSYLNGMQHGTTLTYFKNGKLRDSRAYKLNKSFGKHVGYWENGNQKFEFYYLNDKREGLNKQWYVTGKPYAFLHFKNDMEDGMQQAWRENGKPYINYEAKDGFRYGLQKSGLCYTLADEKLKTKK
jgi:antitoxin component YwqK of YwqJK toxin-antitoxin module